MKFKAQNASVAVATAKDLQRRNWRKDIKFSSNY